MTSGVCQDGTGPTKPDLARPWPRYWARMFDVLIWSSLLVVSAVIWLPAPVAESFGYANGQLAYLAVLPFAMVLDSIVYSLCGNTPGKWLGGIRVLDAGGAKIKFWPHLKREFTVYVRGLGLGIGIVSLFTLISAYRKSAANEVLSWDRELQTGAFQVRSGWWRLYLVACLYIACLGGLVYLGTTMKSPDAAIRIAVAGANLMTPKMIDEDTRFDGAQALPGGTAQFNFTVLSASADTTDSEALRNSYQGEIREAIKKSLCSSDDMKELRDMDATFKYRYSNKDGGLIALISISSSECKLPRAPPP